ncbi:hypothetical protein D3C75_1131020 [compost metagenome]
MAEFILVFLGQMLAETGITDIVPGPLKRHIPLIRGYLIIGYGVSHQLVVHILHTKGKQIIILLAFPDPINKGDRFINMLAGRENR